ncbi:MAG: endonuclease/exonuclease/phosphatase family protein [Verrucomicrobiota bacterium]
MNFRLAFAVTFLAALPACRKSAYETPRRATSIVQHGPLHLRLMTYNVRYENPAEAGSRAWKQRIIHSVRMIRAEHPDVFGIQEALHGQAADLRASLPDYAFTGIGRDDGEKNGEYAAIFYRTDRFDAADHGVFWLSATPETPGSKTWGNGFARIATWIRLIDRVTGRGFYVFNTHWDHRNQPSREKAAALIARRIAARKHRDEPVILLGDFNAVETNPALKTLASAGFVNTFPGRPGHRTTLHFWEGTAAGNRKVDHILVPENTRIIAAKIRDQDKPMLSDHFPVIAEVELP